MTGNPPHRYAVRRLNPAQGVVQVVTIEGARALSHDGRLWELQVLAERPDHTWGSLNQGGRIQQFFRFGNWHPQQGLSRVPANPILDIGAMQQAAGELVAVLEDSLALLPFPQEDRYECWLLDRERQPLALLASSTEASLLPEIRPGRWCATLNSDAGFVSQTLTARGIPTHDGHNPRRHAHEIETLVRKAAGGERRWYHCDQTGARRPVESHARDDTEPVFPALGLREHWPEEWQQALVRDYIDWIAPQLLTWQRLPPQQRDKLERAACRHALALDDAFPLYPDIINPSRLEQARVEARLRRSAGRR